MAAAAEGPRRARCWGRPAGPTLRQARTPPGPLHPLHLSRLSADGAAPAGAPRSAEPGACPAVLAAALLILSLPAPLPAKLVVFCSSCGEEAPLDWFHNPSGQRGCVCTHRRLYTNTAWWWCCNDGAHSTWRFLTAGGHTSAEEMSDQIRRDTGKNRRTRWVRMMLMPVWRSAVCV